MDLDVVNPDSNKTGTVKLPEQFKEEVRPDIIRRAFEYYKSLERQPYGASPEAGMRASGRVSKRRRDYRGSYGMGISRIPRKILSKRGMRMNWVGAIAPGTVKGRRAHPPKASKIWAMRLNTQERRKCIRSALSATMQRDLVSRRHRVPEQYPVVLSEAFEGLSRTAEVKEGLLKLGLSRELERTSERKVRPGRGKMRGRRYVSKCGPLLVVGSRCNLLAAGRNLPGIEVVRVDELNVALLAPGAEPGRLVYFTRPAIEALSERKLFMPQWRKAAFKASAGKAPQPAGEPAPAEPVKRTKKGASPKKQPAEGE